MSESRRLGNFLQELSSDVFQHGVKPGTLKIEENQDFLNKGRKIEIYYEVEESDESNKSVALEED